MATVTEERTQKIPPVGMSAIRVLEGDEKAYSIVGSCIALTLYSPATKQGVLAHIVLSQSHEPPKQPGKYADTAIPEMIRLLAQKKAHKFSLVAKFCGGAAMFGNNGQLKIGEQNVDAVTKILKQLNIPITGTHVAGTKGRHVLFDCQTGSMTIKVAGEVTEIL